MSHDLIVHVVDPEHATAEALAVVLSTYGIDVLAYPDARGFLSALRAGHAGHGCLLVDADLADASALDLLLELRKLQFGRPVIIVTEAASPELRSEAQRLGAADILEKPFATAYLVERLSQLLPNASHLQGAEAGRVRLRDGTRVTFRLMRPEDADIEQEFVRGLSDRSRYLRFFSGIKELSPYMLERLTHPDYPETYAIIATVLDGDRERQIGVARYAPTDVEDVAEFAVVVADEWQGRGIATHLLSALTTAAAIAGIKRLEGLVLKENEGMLNLARALGFRNAADSEDAAVVRVVKVLDDPAGFRKPLH